MTNFEILKSTSSRNLCDMLKAKTIELSDKGYTQIQFEYSSAYEIELHKVEYSVLVIANKE